MNKDSIAEETFYAIKTDGTKIKVILKLKSVTFNGKEFQCHISIQGIEDMENSEDNRKDIIKQEHIIFGSSSFQAMELGMSFLHQRIKDITTKQGMKLKYPSGQEVVWEEITVLTC